MSASPSFIPPVVADANARPWTADEDAVLRARYQVVGAAATAAELGRPLATVHRRAQRLRVQTHRRWTAADDRRLRMLWGDMSIGYIAKALDRTRLTVHWRGRKLGLPAGCPNGFEFVRNAANRAGFASATLWRILTWAGVRTKLTMARPTKGKYRQRIVESDDVDEAVERWMAAEDVNTAARARGVNGETLVRWLEASGLKMPARPGGKQRWRVPSEIIDQVVRARAGRESVMQAARRIGMDRTTLRRRLIAAGHAPPAACMTWWLERSVVDQILPRGSSP